MSPRTVKSKAAKNAAKPAKERGASKKQVNASMLKSKSPSPKGNPLGPKLKQEDNGIKCTKRGKKWIDEDEAWLWESLHEGKSYKEMQRHLERSNVSLRLKIFHMRRTRGVKVYTSGQGEGKEGEDHAFPAAEDEASSAASEAGEATPRAESQTPTPETVAGTAPAATKVFGRMELVFEAIEQRASEAAKEAAAKSSAEKVETEALADEVDAMDLGETEEEKGVEEAEPFPTWPASLEKCSMSRMVNAE